MKRGIALTGKTHAAAGLAVALALGANIPQLALATAGAVLPDIDHSGSTLGKHVKLLSRHLKHRGLTHSLIFLIVTSLLSPYLGLGVLTHIFLDMLNPQGVKLFYPNKTKFRLPLFHSFAKTGGTFEQILFGMFVIAIIFILIFYQNIWGYMNLIEFTTLWYNIELPEWLNFIIKAVTI